MAGAGWKSSGSRTVARSTGRCIGLEGGQWHGGGQQLHASPWKQPQRLSVGVHPSTVGCPVVRIEASLGPAAVAPPQTWLLRLGPQVGEQVGTLWGAGGSPKSTKIPDPEFADRQPPAILHGGVRALGCLRATPGRCPEQSSGSSVPRLRQQKVRPRFANRPLNNCSLGEMPAFAREVGRGGSKGGALLV